MLKKIDLSIITISLEANEKLLRCISSCKFNNILFEQLLIIPKKNQYTLRDFVLPNNIKIILDNGRGVYNAINQGLKQASGDKILLLHGDNYLTKNGSKILQENLFEKTSIQFSSLMRLKDKTLKKFINYQLIWFNLFMGLYPPHPGLLLNKKDLNKIGLYNSNYKICSDFDFYIRMYKNKIPLKYINYDIIVSPSGGISTSGFISIKKIFIERHKILLSHYKFSIFFAVYTIFLGYLIKIFNRNYSEAKLVE